MADGVYACPSCGEPLVWCAGVAASHAYHHEGGVCVVPGKWVTAGEQPAEPAQDVDATAADDEIFGDSAPPRGGPGGPTSATLAAQS